MWRCEQKWEIHTETTANDKKNKKTNVTRERQDTEHTDQSRKIVKNKKYEGKTKKKRHMEKKKVAVDWRPKQNMMATLTHTSSSHLEEVQSTVPPQKQGTDNHRPGTECLQCGHHESSTLFSLATP